MNAPRRTWQRVDGVLLLDKPTGLSSNAALQRARRAFNAEKAGHTGTLDPLASGLLPLCFGEATKFAQFLLDATKAYTATVRFGVTTDTLDAEGRVLETRPVALDRAEVAAALGAFTGTQLQRPPAFSALKHQGRPLYAYARKGEDVPREPREVTIERVALRDWRPPDAIVDVVCSKGTYVRVLAADLGAALGCGAHLAGLVRTATGGFSLADAVGLAALEGLEAPLRMQRLLPVSILVQHLPRLDLEAGAAAAFLHGQPVPAGPALEGTVAVFQGESLLGVAEAGQGMARPRRVLAAEAVGPGEAG